MSGVNRKVKQELDRKMADW